jgi:hypothetical protein
MWSKRGKDGKQVKVCNCFYGAGRAIGTHFLKLKLQRLAKEVEGSNSLV